MQNNKEIKQIIENSGEVLLDSFLEDGIFKEIPIISTLISVKKLYTNISDKILLDKLVVFIQNLDIKSKDEIDKITNKYFKIENYNEIGKRIIYSLQKSESDTKIIWLAKTLRLFINKEINKNDFLRLTSIINNLYVEDAIEISNINDNNGITAINKIVEMHILEHLFSVGLLSIDGFDGGGAYEYSDSGTIYKINRYGLLFKKLILID